MTDRSDARVVTLRFTDGRGQQFVIEPRSDDRDEIEERVLTKGGDWRSVGVEVADAVAIEE